MKKLFEHTLKILAFLFMLYFLSEYYSVLPLEEVVELEELTIIILAIALLLLASFVRLVYECSINIKGYKGCSLPLDIRQQTCVGIQDSSINSEAEQIELVGLHD